jgi:hypothetical protein
MKIIKRLIILSIILVSVDTFSQITINDKMIYGRLLKESNLLQANPDAILKLFLESIESNSRIHANRSLPDYDWLLEKRTRFGWEDSVWINKQIDSLSHDDQNRLYVKVIQLWDDSLWENYRKYNYSYDDNNNSYEELVQRWSFGTWRNNWLYTHIHDTNKNLKERLAKYWSSTTWGDHSREIYIYDINNNLLEEDMEKLTNTFNENNNLIQSVLEDWDDSIWVNYWQYRYSYDANSNVAELIFKVWNDSIWVNLCKVSYEYDSNNNLIGSIFYVWNGKEWIELMKLILFYDKNDNVIKELQRRWIDSVWVNDSKWIYEYIPVTGMNNMDGEIDSYDLSQNYPNPFNPSTTIQFAVTSRQLVALKVYDILGNEIATLVNEVKTAGTYEVEWDASGLPSGVYFYQLKSKGYVETKKMLLIK